MTVTAERCSRHSASRFGSNRNLKSMAKTSMVEREKRRAGIVKKYAAKRAKLKELIRSPRSSPEARAAAVAALQAQPRDASAARLRNRCAITGRSRGVYRKFGLSRVTIREVASRGEYPGPVQAKWGVSAQ